MPSGPSKTLETLAGLLIPPACREEVLGDLHERYKSPGRYLFDAASTAPFVLLSRMRRTTEAQVLIMEALLLYAAFLVSAWHYDSALMKEQWALAGLAIPAGFMLAVVVLEAAWAPKILIFGPLLCGWCLKLLLPWLTWTVSLYGLAAGMFLVSSLRWMFRLGLGPSHAATGPEFRTEPAAQSNTTKSLVAAAGAIVMVAIFSASTGIKGGVSVMIVLVVFELTRLRRE
jgi:hypothetical protein